MGILAARRWRRRSTKRYLASIGRIVDRRTLRRMTSAADRRVAWWLRLGVALPGLALLAGWMWMFRGVTRAGGSPWRIGLLMLLYVGLPTLLVVHAIRTVQDRIRRPALYRALREDFHIPVCTTCGYDLRGSGGLAAARCPECGATFTRENQSSFTSGVAGTAARSRL